MGRFRELLLALLATMALAEPPLHLVNETADIFILQYHFKNDGPESLDDWYHQLRNYGLNYSPRALPTKLLWRVAPPSLRDDPKTLFPSLEQNMETIKQIKLLYASLGLAGPRFVYYPDVEKEYAQLWGTNPQQQAALRADPTLAVSVYLGLDLDRWPRETFDEVIVEEYGAPLTPPAKGHLVSPTLVSLRASPMMSKMALSLTPDFSVLGGRCKKNVLDDCALLVGNRSRSWHHPPGVYYLQSYNIYTQNDASGNGSVLTDVTPWSPDSKGEACERAETPEECGSSSCCEWVGLDHRCAPVTWDKPTIQACLIPDPGLCRGNELDGCFPPVGGSVYTRKFRPAQAARHVAKIFGERVLTRCRPGGSAIESLDKHSFWETFPAIFSYEPWSDAGPPLYLMGNPTYTYTNAMWSDFISTFKSALKRELSAGSPGSLCAELAETVEHELQIGVYWARQAIAAWNQTKPTGL